MVVDFRISLSAARANADMNQQEWADAIGVDKATVVNWEAGRTEPGLSQLRKISEMSKIPMDYIFVPTKS